MAGPSTDRPEERLRPDAAGSPERRQGAALSPEFLTDLFRDPLEPGYADAAARRAATTGSPPGGRWSRPGFRALTLVTLLVIGLLFAVAYRQVLAEEPDRAQVRAELLDRIGEREAETEELRQYADELRTDVGRLRDQALTDPAARELRQLEAITGLAPVTGDGLVVRVADAAPQVEAGTGAVVTDPEARILDQDLQRVANALWAAGAEAVAINGHRLTATSTIRNASGAVLVDYVPVASPYEVVAIGPGELRDRFADSETGQLLELLVNRYGISYDLRSERRLELPGSSTPQLHHAAPGRVSSVPEDD